MSDDAPKVVAIYGGSFNPPHNAHVMVAAHVAQDPQIDALWIIPTFAHAFDKALLDYDHRLRMCELAFAGIDKARVLDIERHLPGRSLMVNTLRALKAQHPDVRLRLVIGSDLVDELRRRWSEPDAIEALAPLWIVQRQDNEHVAATGPVFPPISSTTIRARLARGESIDDLVPRAVVQHIAAHRLYATASPA